MVMMIGCDEGGKYAFRCGGAFSAESPHSLCIRASRYGVNVISWLCLEESCQPSGLGRLAFYLDKNQAMRFSLSLLVADWLGRNIRLSSFG